MLALLFDEALDQCCGRNAGLDRLFEVVLIQMLRNLVEREQTQLGVFAGLAHPRLRNGLVAMHARPAEEWGLDALASAAACRAA